MPSRKQIQSCVSKVFTPIEHSFKTHQGFIISVADRHIWVSSLKRNLLWRPFYNFRHPMNRENRLSLKAALLGYGRIGDSLPFHRHFWKQVPQNNGSTFRIDIRIWALKPPGTYLSFLFIISNTESSFLSFLPEPQWICFFRNHNRPESIHR